MNNAQESVPSDEEGDSPRQTGIFRRLFGTKKSIHATPSTVRQTELAQNFSQLKNRRISDIAIPKADIVALPIDTDMETFFATLREHGYSRIPVFSDTLDDPSGLVHVKDLFMTYGLDGEAKNFSLEPFVRPLIYVPPSMRVSTLLQKMQSDHIHMALVIDEFGGVDGLITIEDILEQIVGEITDEHDETNETLWSQERPGIYLVKARTSLEDFERETGVVLPMPEDEDDIDTIGGLIITHTARVPAKGEVIKTDTGFEFEILEADPRRIKTVRIRLPKNQYESDL